MIALVSLLVLLSVVVAFVRTATMALTMTGLSQELAQFQAISAFTGVGFTTSESEAIVNHPVRRRILTWVMILGSAGIVGMTSTFFLSFMDASGVLSGVERAALLAAGAIGLWWMTHSRWIERHTSRVIRGALIRWTRLESYDFNELLDLGGQYAVRQFTVRAEDWVAGRRLDELKLPDEGITLLGIHRPDGTYLGLPRSSTRIEPGDRAVVYGRQDLLSKLSCRPSGSQGHQAHEQAVAELRRSLAETTPDAPTE